MVTLKHAFVSPKADGGDATLVKPSNWNAEHAFFASAANRYLGTDATPPGAGGAPIQEHPIDAGVGDDYTMMTKQQVQAAIATALGSITQPTTGDLTGSLAATKSGWVLCNGQRVRLAGGVTQQALFNLLWAINGNTWPVYTAGTTTLNRGASALADWTAGKEIPVPDARGCVLGMVDLGAGVNALIDKLGIKYGEREHILTLDQMPPHDHPPDPTAVNFLASGGSSPVMQGGGGGNIYAAVNTGLRGGNPLATPAFSAATPTSLVQPTMGVNIFIKL